MADCEGEKTIHYEEDGWSVTLTRSVWMESPFWDSVKAMEEKPQ